ncbi:MAG: ATP-binding protein [Coriobacteriia bacterium]|nr:ATP-binding protein [Coriobacteriia bacterium]
MGDSPTVRRGRERALAPFAWAGAACLILLCVWWVGTDWYRADRAEARRLRAVEQVRHYAQGLHAAVQSHVSLVEGLSRYVSDEESGSGLTKAGFDTFAAGQYSSSRGIRTIQVAPRGVIRWTYPLVGNERAIGLDLYRHVNPEIRADALAAANGRMPVVSGPHPLAQGGLGLTVRQTVVVKDSPWGIVAVVIDVPSLIRDSGLTDPTTGLEFTVRDAHGRVVSGSAAAASDSVTAGARLPDGVWRVSAAPADGWDAASANTVNAVRILGLAIVLLGTLVVYMVASRQDRLSLAVAAATSELRESAQRYRALFEDSPVSLWEEDFSAVKKEFDVLRERGIEDFEARLTGDIEELRRVVGLVRIVAVNNTTVSLYGAHDRDELMQGLDAFITSENAHEFVEQMMAVADGRTSFSMLTRLPRPDGMRDLVVTWTVVPGHERDYASVVVSVVDLTERVRAEQELHTYRANLERLVSERTSELQTVNDELTVAQQAKDRFLASMSHELRTPLNSVLGFTGIMLQGDAGPLSDEQRRQLEMVRRSGRQLLALVNDMLDLAKIQEGHLGLEVLPFDPVAVAAAAVESLRPLADDKGLSLEIDVDRCAPVRIDGDLDRTRQVLLNLLGNAIKYTDAGGVRMEVRGEGTEVVFAVRDTGPGIPATDREAVFLPFHQVQRDPARISQGTGLGLAISRELADALGGSLRLVDGDSTGSIFEFRLPVEGAPGR